MLNSLLSQIKSWVRAFEIKTNRAVPSWMAYSSLFFIIVAVFIKIWTPTSVNRWPEALYTLFFVVALFKERGSLLTHPLMLGLYSALLLTPTLFALNYLQNPERALEYAHFEKLIRVYLFLPIAYWLSFNLRYAYIFLAAGFLGLLTACLQDPELTTSLGNALRGQRVDFNVMNAQHVANWCGLFLIISVALITDRDNKRFSAKVVLTIAALLCLFGLYAAQTRALFIALSLCALFWFFSFTLKFVNQLTFKNRILALAASILFVLTSAYFAINANSGLKERFSSELPVILAVTKLDFSDIPSGSSVGIRLHSWGSALNWIAKKPVIGWGGKVRNSVIDSVPAFNKPIKDQFGHLHNSYLEFLVGYGLIGLLVAFWPIFWAIGAITKSRPRNFRTIAMYGTISFVVVNAFESYLFFWTGVFSLSLFLSPIAAHSFKKILEKEPPTVLHH